MARVQRFVVTAEQAGLRLDQFLASTGAVSRTRARALLAAGSVYVERKRTKVASREMFVGQVVELFDVVLDAAPPPVLPVLYQDEALVVVHKPVGMPVQPARETDQRCVTTSLSRQLGMPVQELRVVHRLDTETSGVVVVALTRPAAADLSAQLAEHRAQRQYVALSVGTAEVGEQLEHFLTPPVPQERGPARVLARPALGEPFEDERLARSFCRCLAQAEGYSLLRVTLETGRTHQIRAQLSAVGLPLLGDLRYDAPQLPSDWRGGGIGLHAAALRLRHPSSRQELEIHAPLPEAFQHWLQAHGLWTAALQPDGAGKLPCFIQESRNGEDQSQACS